MIRSESVQMIREKALEGKSAYRIAQELGISKNTAKKYMDTGSTEKAQYPKRQSKIDAFKPEIDRLMSIAFQSSIFLPRRFIMTFILSHRALILSRRDSFRIFLSKPKSV